MESRKMVLMTYLQGSNGDTENRLMDMDGGKERVGCMNKVNMEIYSTLCKTDSQWEFAYDSGNSNRGSGTD